MDSQEARHTARRPAKTSTVTGRCSTMPHFPLPTSCFRLGQRHQMPWLHVHGLHRPDVCMDRNCKWDPACVPVARRRCFTYSSEVVPTCGTLASSLVSTRYRCAGVSSSIEALDFRQLSVPCHLCAGGCRSELQVDGKPCKSLLYLVTSTAPSLQQCVCVTVAVFTQHVLCDERSRKSVHIGHSHLPFHHAPALMSIVSV